jgi:hypothetical protein
MRVIPGGALDQFFDDHFKKALLFPIQATVDNLYVDPAAGTHRHAGHSEPSNRIKHMVFKSFTGAVLLFCCFAVLQLQ